MHVIPCIEGRTDNCPSLAGGASGARCSPRCGASARRPGPRPRHVLDDACTSCEEKAAAEMLGIPDHVMQGALIPVAHTLGAPTSSPAPRRDLDRIIHIDTW